MKHKYLHEEKHIFGVLVYTYIDMKSNIVSKDKQLKAQNMLQILCT